MGIVITEDTRLDDLEFSARTLTALKAQDIHTLGGLKYIGVAHLRQHAKNFGARAVRECEEMLQHLEPPSLFNSPEQIAYRMESYLGSAQALMHDVQRIMQRAALKGIVSAETRKDAARKLVEAARYIEKLPAHGDTE